MQQNKTAKKLLKIGQFESPVQATCVTAKTMPNAAPTLNACPVADQSRSDASSVFKHVQTVYFAWINPTLTFQTCAMEPKRKCIF